MSRFHSSTAVLLMLGLGACKETDSPGDETGDADTQGDSTDVDTSDVDTDDVDTDDVDTEGTDSLTAPRVVLVIADDFGVDALSSYSGVFEADASARDFPLLPVIDGICDEGVRFDEAWATPTCTPTRGSVLTGAHGFRTNLDGVGGAFQIDPTIDTLPRILQVIDGFEGANIGKWHLGHAEDSGGAMTPNLSGWDHYSGSLANVDNYTDWERVQNGVATAQTEYATTVQVDDAIEWWTARPANEPSLLWLAFNAPHVPFHQPPDGLYSQTSLQSVGQRYDAAVEAMDTELGRLMAVLDDDVVVIFLGDNGTPGRVIRADHSTDRAKGALYQGGIHVPLCVRGPGIDAGVHTGLVSSVD